MTSLPKKKGVFGRWLKKNWWLLPILLAVALLSIFSIGKLFGLYVSLYNDSLVWFFTLGLIGAEIGGLSVVARMYTLEFTGRKLDVMLAWLAIGLIVVYEMIGTYAGSIATMYNIPGDLALSKGTFGVLPPEGAGVVFALITALVWGLTNFIYIKIITGMVIARKELLMVESEDMKLEEDGVDKEATPDIPFRG